MGEHKELFISVLTAIVGVAILAVLLSSKSQTSNVIGAASRGLGGLIATAISPITGASPGSFGTFSQNASSSSAGAGNNGGLLNNSSNLISNLGNIVGGINAIGQSPLVINN